MRLNDVHFLPGDDPSGWTVASSVNEDDTNNLGSFVTVTLRGTKPGQLDFEYQISVSKTGNDILVSLGRSNNTGKAVDMATWTTLCRAMRGWEAPPTDGSAWERMSRNRDYYDLWPVIHLISPKCTM